MRKLTFLLTFMLFVVFQASAQMTISGKVTNAETGEPIPGASVVVKSQTTIGTTTNMDGNYTLQGVPADAETLVFSFVGMQEKEVAINGRTTIDVELAPSVQEMEEVVVTAMGISKEKKALGYSTSQASGGDIEEGGSPDIESGLSGKISGLEVRQSSGMPGAPSQILIRGATSFSSDNQPLYVVDGMPIKSDNDYGSNVTGSAYSNRAMDIPPSQIESINVLKGQAAAALYGMRASNGVIIIETKSGANAEMGKPRVTINSSYTQDNVSTLPDVQQTWAQGSNGVFDPGGTSFSWGPKIEDLPDDPVYGGNNYSGHAGEFFDPYKNEWAEPKAYNNPENFYDRNGQTFKSSVTISNKIEAGNYSVSFSNTTQNGIIKNTGMDRYNAKASGDFNLTDKWSVKFSTNFSKNQIRKVPSGNDSWLFTVYGAPPSYDLAGTKSDLGDVEGEQFGEYRQISYRTGSVGNNPYWAIDNNVYKEQTNRFFGNASLQYQPFEWMTAKYQLGVDTYTNDNKDYEEMGMGALPGSANLPTPNNREYGYWEPSGGSIDHYGVTRNIVNSLFTLTMEKDFSQDLGGSLLLGNEFNDNQAEFYGSYGSGFKTPGWDDLGNTGVQNSSYTHSHTRTVGFFGEGSLDFKSMLYLNLTGRYDIVSNMPRGNRGFFYPSVSLGFVFSELDAFDALPFLSYGKLRAAYSEVGQGADAYRPEPVFVTGGVSSGFLSWGPAYPLNGVTGYKPSAFIYDKQLTPQNSREMEFGLDLQFFDGRLGLNYTYFDQTNEDQIFGVPIAGSTGYAQYVTNAGNMTSEGHEVTLSLTPVQTKNFTWTAQFDFSKINNVTEELAEGVESITLGGYVEPNIRASAGDAYPAIYGNKFQRDEDGNILIDDDPSSSTYGMPMAGEFGKIGEVTPDFNLGLRNTFTLFKNFRISGHLHWKEGGQMYSGSNRLIRLYGTAAAVEDRDEPFVYEGVKASSGEENDIELSTPSEYQTLHTSALDAMSEDDIVGTSFIKLRSASINYTLPASLFSNFFVEKASVGISIRNVLLWSEMDNFDPETSQGQGNMAGGMDYMSLPQTESYGFNVNFTF